MICIIWIKCIICILCIICIIWYNLYIINVSKNVHFKYGQISTNINLYRQKTTTTTTTTTEFWWQGLVSSRIFATGAMENFSTSRDVAKLLKPSSSSPCERATTLPSGRPRWDANTMDLAPFSKTSLKRIAASHGNGHTTVVIPISLLILTVPT